ncbi:MAG: glycosyltransferase family 9 protein, partial [Candidatus Binataceae bacterium]
MLARRGNAQLRRLDRYAGIPLVAALGMLRHKRSIPLAPRRIGVLNTAAIGDTILMGAAIADLRTAYPDAFIAAFTGPTNSEAARLLRGPDTVVELSLIKLFDSLRRLRLHALDILFDFGPWPRLNALVTALAGARFSVGFRTRGQYRHYAHDLAVNHRDDVHELENHRALIRAAGVETRELPSINRSLLPSEPAKDKRRIIFHLWPGGARAKVKEWPLDRWARLATELAGQDYNIVLTGAPGQFSANEALLHLVDPPIQRRLTNAAGLSLRTTASLLSGARLVISVDTGIMHLAAAIGAPLIAIHGPTSSRRWGPVGPSVAALESPLGGCGYLDLGFEFSPQAGDCMRAISYQLVS